MRIILDRNLRALLWTFIGVAAFLSSRNASVSMASAIAFAIFALCLWRSYQTNGFFDGVTMLLLFMGLFHLGIVVPVYLFGAERPLIEMSWLFETRLPFSIAISALGMAMTCAGSEFAAGNERVSSRSRDKSSTIFVFWAIAVLAFAALYLILGFRSDILFSPRTVYLSLRETGEAAPFGIAKSFMILSGFIAASFAPKRWGVFIAIFVLTMLLPMFAYGKRGEFLVTAAAFAVVLNKKGIRFPKLFTLSAFIGVLSLVSLLRNVRGGVESFSPVAILDPIYEMGMQLRTVHYTVVALNKGLTDYWYGESYFQAFMRSVPNVLDVRSVVGGAGADAPATWLTNLFRPGGAGLGYSIFAEPFLNFGLAGVIVILFLVGFSVRKFDRWSTNSLGSLAIYGVFVQSILWAVRNDFYGVFRPIVWVLLLLFISGLIMDALGKKPTGAVMPREEVRGG